MVFPDHPFWDFSLAVHRWPGVPEACLALQRGCGLDVNLLLFCCWAAVHHGRPLGLEGMARALGAAAGWQEEVVRPIWKARWRLKGGFEGFPSEQTEPLRKALLAAELDAEHIEQLRLAEAVPLSARPEADDAMRLVAAAANIADYVHASTSKGETLSGHWPPDDLVAPLNTLLSCVFPGLDTSLIQDDLVRALKERRE